MKLTWNQLRRRNQALKNENITCKETKVGRGIFAKQAFRPLEDVCSFTGTLCPIEENPSDDYAITYDESRLIMPDKESVGGHLINHSCKPNVTFTNIWVGCSMIITAIRPIAAGEQITSYYGWIGSDKPAKECLCGEKFCTGKMGLVIANGGISEEDVKTLFRVAWENRNLSMIDSLKRALFQENFFNISLQAVTSIEPPIEHFHMLLLNLKETFPEEKERNEVITWIMNYTDLRMWFTKCWLEIKKEKHYENI